MTVGRGRRKNESLLQYVRVVGFLRCHRERIRREVEDRCENVRVLIVDGDFEAGRHGDLDDDGELFLQRKGKHSERSEFLCGSGSAGS